ncbi:hypothetical protein [Nevskia soli]|uniref:hypothetical protein n=1 Tax=Nevskia soli TaxID=418856 RepID=UPI0015D6C0D4|nr:hypothetical protein [Nevskia soli]
MRLSYIRFALTLLTHGAFAQGPHVCQPVLSNLLTVATAAQREAAGAKAIPPITDQQNGFAWPDTSLGVIRSDSGLVFFASDGAHHDQNNKYGSVTRTVGTLDNPLGTGSPVDVVISPNLTINPNYPIYTYLGGARVHAIPQGAPGAGNLLIVYHAEINTETSFYSLLGLALSTDGGGHWTDLGEIVRPNQPYREDLAGFDIGSEPLVVSLDREYFYVYFPDWIANGTTQPTTTTNVSVARASIASVYAAAGAQTPHAAAFSKYFEGEWNQPGIGGLSTDLNPNAGYAGDPNVAYNSALKRYVMINDDTQHIAYSESTDGFTWTLPILLGQDITGITGVNYAVAIGDGADPNLLGQEFYVFYTFSSAEGWPGNTLRRFTVTCRAD